MITSINEDEIQRLLIKLYTLEFCMRIRNLGYIYPPNEYVTILTQDIEGWQYIDEVDTINSIIEPTLGTGYCNLTSNVLDDLNKFNVKIPYNEYNEDEVMGFTINIASEIIDKIIDLNINVEQVLISTANQIDYDNMSFEDATVPNCQIIIDKENRTGIYIIAPVTYVSVEWFVSTYIGLIEDLHKKVEEAIKNQEKEKEAA